MENDTKMKLTEDKLDEMLLVNPLSVQPESEADKVEEKRKNPGTPYDDVGKTLLYKCPRLIIPIINEIFDETFDGTEEIIFCRTEYLKNAMTGKAGKRIVDSCFEISGKEKKKYHVELQSRTDNTVVFRVFEYDVHIALDDGVMDGYKLTITFPKSAVIYLRHEKNTPDAMTVEIKTPGGDVSYQMPILKTQKYSLEEIFEKKMYYLLPFYIFCYEAEFKEIENDETKLEKLKQEFARIQERLDVLSKKGELSEYEKYAIISMIKKVVENLAIKYENIRKGIDEVIGGRILDFEADRILQRGINQGISQGIAKGKIMNTIEFIKAGLVSLADAAEKLNMTEEELMQQMK